MPLSAAARWRRILSPTALVCLAVTAVIALIVSRSWIIDDAYITLRMIDNAIHGYGLRWNVGERVQAFTHPLWAFCLFIGYAVTREPYFSSLLMSLSISACTIIIIGFGITRDRIATAIALAVLALSRGFIDFSAANLENPLSHALIALFVGSYARNVAPTRRSLTVLSVLGGLLILVRMDFALLIGPALAVRMWRNRRDARGALLIGLLPVAGWTVVATFYYGFPFPNTAYAKLAHGVSSTEQMIQGLCYLLEGLVMDPLTLIASLTAVSLLLRRPQREAWPMAAGVALYLFYIVRVGGDYMSGRFLAAPFLLSVLLFLAFAADERIRRRRLLVLAIVGVLAAGSKWVVPPATRTAWLRQHFSDDDPKWKRRRARNTFRYINDQRGDVNQTSLFSVLGDPDHQLHHEWIDLGRALKQRPRVYVSGAVGLLGFYAGPAVHIVDAAALADPLLARLPATRPWFVGHYDRRIPRGYEASLQADANLLEDPALRSYYDDLRLVTRGPLWSWDRFKAIVRLNLGRGEERLADYGALDATAQRQEGAWVFSRDEGVDIWERGLRLKLDPPSTARKLVLIMRDALRYEVRYFSNGKQVASQFVEVPDDTKQSVIADVAVKPGVSFDRIDLLLAEDGLPATIFLLRLQ